MELLYVDIRYDHNQDPAVFKVTEINYHEKTAKKKRRASWSVKPSFFGGELWFMALSSFLRIASTGQFSQHMYNTEKGYANRS